MRLGGAVPGLRCAAAGLVLLAAAVAAAVAAGEDARPPAGPKAETCALPAEDLAWLQKALDGWVVVNRLLDTRPLPLPHMVLFDGECAYELGAAAPPAGAAPLRSTLRVFDEPVTIHARAHGGTIVLPDGKELPPRPIAVAFPPPEGGRPFYALALPAIWREHVGRDDPLVVERILGVTVHEMLHTRQLPELRRRVDELGERWELPPRFDDDVIQRRFAGRPGYAEAFAAEVGLLWRAVAATGDDEARSLAGRALEMAERRRERYFTGEEAVYGELEELFLTMEGLAEWARFHFTRLQPSEPREDAEILGFLRGRENDWSQDEGLALFLLLDRFAAPEWRRRALGPEMASPFVLLREAPALRCQPGVGPGEDGSVGTGGGDDPVR